MGLEATTLISNGHEAAQKKKNGALVHVTDGCIDGYVRWIQACSHSIPEIQEMNGCFHVCTPTPLVRTRPLLNPDPPLGDCLFSK